MVLYGQISFVSSSVLEGQNNTNKINYKKYGRSRLKTSPIRKS